MESGRGRVQQVIHLLVVDLQEGALAQELHQLTKLRERRAGTSSI